MSSDPIRADLLAGEPHPDVVAFVDQLMGAKEEVAPTRDQGEGVVSMATDQERSLDALAQTAFNAFRDACPLLPGVEYADLMTVERRAWRAAASAMAEQQFAEIDRLQGLLRIAAPMLQAGVQYHEASTDAMHAMPGSGQQGAHETAAGGALFTLRLATVQSAAKKVLEEIENERSAS